MVHLKKSLALVAILLICNASAQSASTWDYKTMKSYGANLGGWLSLERWIQPSLFEIHAPNAIDEWTFCEQATNPAEALEEHWNTFITEDHIRRFASVNGNHLRIPVGYWAFITPDVGEPYVSTGQKAQLERILRYCAIYNIHVFIDVHSNPGSQNGEHHSGRTGEIEFYTPYNIQRSLNTVRGIVEWMNGLNPTVKARIAGISPVNEPHVENDEIMTILKRFYLDAYDIIQASPYKVAMIFCDGFQGLSAWTDFLPATANAVIDLHPYHAFPPQYDTTSILNSICEKASNNFPLPIIYGEWSLASGVENSNEWFRQMMDSQVYAYITGGAGFTFWTLRNNAVKGELCDSADESVLPLYYNCFEGITWSMNKLIELNIVDVRTFSDYPNQQCYSSGNSFVLVRSNVFLLIVSLMVCIKMVLHGM